MDNKIVFIAFAKEDERTRDLFVGQRKLANTPYNWTDMSVKNPYDTEWKQHVRTRIRRSDGVIALISSNTPKATGQLWEITCAREEGKPLLGIWIEDGYRTKPVEMGPAPAKSGPGRTSETSSTGSEVLRRALVVGIDHYRSYRDLGGCVNDATALGPLHSR